MRKDILLLTFLFVLFGSILPASAQKKDKTLNITVVATTGENLSGQPVSVKQTDYDVAYSNITLNAEGKATLKAYAGNHTVAVTRDGYEPATTSFNIADGETEKNVSLTLVEKTRKPFAFNAKLNVDPFTGKNSVALTWNTEAPAFFDDFESYDPFTITFGDWTGIDGDHLMTAPLTGDYPNRGVMQYAQIINPLTVDPMWWYSYPVLRPYDGKQYVGFVRTASGEANDDWLISPEITVGTDNILSFYAKAADKYNEEFFVYITTKTDSPVQSDFTLLTKGNAESVDYKSWHEMQYDLSQYAGKKVKIAIRYVGEANSTTGAFMLMVDNFYVGQPDYTSQLAAAKQLAAKAHRVTSDMAAFSPANPNERFEVYMDDALVATTDGYTYNIDDVADGTHTFGVKAKYLMTESEMVTTTIDVNHDGYAAADFTVSSNSKLTADGQKLNMLSTASGETYTAVVAGGKASFKALSKGQYLMNIGGGAFKEQSVNIDLTADSQYDLTLEDNVITPYNITADLTTADDGTQTAQLKWNQDLGFTDSFEDYDDFATGEFGGWKTIDNDKMPVYPISLAGSIISFPGSGTQSSPTAIPPMVFNPAKTEPAMVPTDKAMYAPTGDKYVIFFSPQSSQADKWLISPELTIYDGYELQVTAKSYADTYPETLEFAVSEGSDDPTDFVKISTAAKMPSDQWSVFTTPLTDYVGKKVRIGIHYISYDTFFAQLDDFKVGPAAGSASSVDYGNVVNYNVYLDSEKVGEPTTPKFTLRGITAGTHTVAIEAVYQGAVSEKGYYNIEVSSIGTITSVEAIPADAEVYSLSGQRIATSISSLPKGVYVVKSGEKVMKVRF